MNAAQPRRTLWRFASVGLVNTLAALAFIYAARALGLGEIAANAIGFAAGLMPSFVLSFARSFVLNRRWTFAHCGAWPRLALRFGVVVAVAWAANVLVLLALLGRGVNAALAQAVAVLPYAVLSCLGCRWWVFAPAGSGLSEGRT
jgi:putative flippase GtrA